jgi:peptidyl-prolyl cis-trans isomerase C
VLAVAIGAVGVSCKKAPASGSAAPSASAPAAAAPPSGAAAPGATAGPAASPALPPPPKPVPAQIPPVVAKVNGEPIEKWEFENAIRSVEARAGGPVPAERRDEILRGVLDQLVAFHLLAQEAHARKLVVADADVDAQLADIRRGFPSEDVFKQEMSKQGVSLDQIKSQARMRLEVSKLIDAEITAKIAVPDADVDAFYKQNPERFKQNESVHASHILIGVPQNATPQQKAQAKSAAQDALKKARAGADFAALAKERSNDSSAQNGGDLGFVPRGQTVPAFEDAAFKLKPGQMSGVVETQFGYHIIKVHEHRDARTAPFAEVSAQIKQFLEQGQRETKLQQFVETARARARIEVLV